MNESEFSEFLDHMDPELSEALLSPMVIEDNIGNLRKVNEALTEPGMICDNPETELPHVPVQVNFLLPANLKKSKEPYAKNIKNDLNMYRKLYEKYSTDINHIIDKTKESINNLYPPLKSLREEIKSYSNNFEDSLKQLAIPLENKRDGLNKINYKNYPKDKQEKFLKDKNEVIKEINNFIKDVHLFCEDYGKMNKNIYIETEVFFLKFMNVAEPAKNLTIFMKKFFKVFEKSGPSFNDLKNKKKIDEALQKIKEPIDDLCLKIKNTDELLKQIQEIEKGKIENIKDVVKNIKKKMNDLKKESDEISKHIMNIREKYGETKEELKSMNMNEPPALNIGEYSEKIEKEQKVIKEETDQKFKDLLIDAEKIKNQSRLDLLFIMDITNSMDVYLDQAKSDILKMIRKIQSECAGIDIFLGFIGYRDFNDLDFGDEYIDLELTNNYEQIRENIQYLKAEGGGDTPEDLCGGLELAKNKNWRGKSRFSILVTDSPCHGNKYHDLKGEDGDNFPDGDREKRNIEDYIKFFAENEISLYCLKIRSITDKMFNIFKNIYDESKANSSAKDSANQFVVEEQKKIFDIVTENAIKLFQNRKSLELS